MIYYELCTISIHGGQYRLVPGEPLILKIGNFQKTAFTNLKDYCYRDTKLLSKYKSPEPVKPYPGKYPENTFQHSARSRKMKLLHKLLN